MMIAAIKERQPLVVQLLHPLPLLRPQQPRLQLLQQNGLLLPLQDRLRQAPPPLLPAQQPRQPFHRNKQPLQRPHLR